MNAANGAGVTKVPGWTVVVAAIFGTIGVAISTLMYIDPSAAPFLSRFEITPELEPLTAAYAVRNSITALVLLIAVWMRTPTALFAAVSGRMITELMDGARTLIEGPDATLIGVVIVLLVPAALVLWKLWPLVQIEMAAARATREEATLG